MFEDLTNKSEADMEKEIKELREILKEAKREIIKEQARRFVLEDLNNENTQAARKFADMIHKYRDRFGKQDFDKLEEEGTDKWDKEDD